MTDAPTRARPAARPRRETSPALVQLITEHIERKGITRYVLAQQLGLSRGYFYNLMAGKASPPSEETLRAMATALDGDPDRFLFAAGILPQDLEAELLQLPPAAIREFIRDERRGEARDA